MKTTTLTALTLAASLLILPVIVPGAAAAGDLFEVDITFTEIELDTKAGGFALTGGAKTEAPARVAAEPVASPSAAG